MYLIRPLNPSNNYLKMYCIMIIMTRKFKIPLPEVNKTCMTTPYQVHVYASEKVVNLLE